MKILIRKTGPQTLYRVEGSLYWTYSPRQAVDNYEAERLNTPCLNVVVTVT